MAALVERMLELNNKKHSGRLAPSELDRLERDIAATDAEIDELVYELYEITDGERKIIQGMYRNVRPLKLRVIQSFEEPFGEPQD